METILKEEERQLCEVWTRVMGYYRPTSEFNIGKQGEFEERVNFIEKPNELNSAALQFDDLK